MNTSWCINWLAALSLYIQYTYTMYRTPQKVSIAESTLRKNSFWCLFSLNEKYAVQSNALEDQSVTDYSSFWNNIGYGRKVLCGHFQKFGGKLLTLWALLFTFLRVIIVLCGNMAKINNRAEANKLMLSGKISKN